jgi:uncharacterized membrane protein
MQALHQKFFITINTIATLLLPTSFVFAQGSGGSCSTSLNTLANVFDYATCILTKSVIPLIVTIALVAFMYGVVQYLINAEDENKRKEGRKYMLWGIISLFVMLGIIGILQVLGNTFDIGFGGGIDTITPQF